MEESWDSERRFWLAGGWPAASRGEDARPWPGTRTWRSLGGKVDLEIGDDMIGIEQAAGEFLANKRIAVTGVSRDPKNHGANIVYQRLRDRGYEVFAINPNADEVEGDPCWADLKTVPGGVDAVVIGTRAATAEATMRECVDLGIHHVWMHRLVGDGSVSTAATEYGREHGVRVIDGGCPLMFDPTADGAHKVMRRIFTWTGKVPRCV